MHLLRRAASRAAAAFVASVSLAAGAVVMAPPAAAYDPITVTVTGGCALFVGDTTVVEVRVDVTGDDAADVAVTLGPTAPTGITIADAPSAAFVPAGEAHLFRVTLAVAADAAREAVTVPFVVTSSVGNGGYGWSTGVYGPPPAPTNVVADARDRLAIVEWSQPGRSAYDRYVVTASPGGAIQAASGAGTIVMFRDLTNGVPYTFTVTVYDRLGQATSEPSAPVTPAGAPFPVPGVTVTGTGATRTVSWDPADGNGLPVTEYTVIPVPGDTYVRVGPDVRSVEMPTPDPDVDYTFRVVAANARGYGRDYSYPPVAPPPGLPDAFTGTVTVQRAGPRAIRVSLAGLDPAMPSYEVAVFKAAGDQARMTTGGAESADVTFENLVDATTYVFTVTPVNASGRGPATAAAPFFLYGVPDQPDIRTWAGHGGADFCLFDAWGHGRPVTAYVVTATVAGVPVTTWTLAPGVRSGFLDGLDNGTTYRFSVHAVNDVGESPDWTTWPDDVTPRGVPSVPFRVGASDEDDGSVLVGWYPPSGNGLPVTGYEITSHPGNVTKLVHGDGTYVHVSGLTPHTSYTFTVRARNAVGLGPASEPTNAVTAFAAPAPVTVVTATPLDGAAHVTWSAPDDNGATIRDYVVRSSPDTGAHYVSGTMHATDVDGLVNGTAYTFTVDAENRAGLTSGTTASAPVTPFGAPGAVSGVTATRTSGGVHVTWSAADGNGTTVTGYTVVASPGGATVAVDGSTLTADVTGLASGTTYTFTVRATNAAGDGANSVPSNAVTPDGTPPVVGVAALPAFTLAGTIGLHYGATDPGSGVASYDVRYRVAPAGGTFGAYAYPAAWQRVTATTVTRVAARGLTFCFSVAARDVFGNVSPFSAERCTATPLDDRSLTASAGWAATTAAAYYGGTMRSTATRGSTLTRTGVTARRLALVVTRCATCGTVGVYLNGVLLKQVSLAASRTAYQQVVAVDLGSVRSGTVTVRALDTRRVYVDGLGVSRV